MPIKFKMNSKNDQERNKQENTNNGLQNSVNIQAIGAEILP